MRVCAEGWDWDLVKFQKAEERSPWSLWASWCYSCKFSWDLGCFVFLSWVKFLYLQCRLIKNTCFSGMWILCHNFSPAVSHDILLLSCLTRLKLMNKDNDYCYSTNDILLVWQDGAARLAACCSSATTSRYFLEFLLLCILIPLFFFLPLSLFLCTCCL